MWIKWQNLATPARSLAACLASPRLVHAHGLGPAGGGGGAHARVALLCPFLSFSINMDNFQPNKLSQLFSQNFIRY
jgi:hypothetical protein